MWVDRSRADELFQEICAVATGVGAKPCGIGHKALTIGAGDRAAALPGYSIAPATQHGGWVYLRHGHCGGC